VLKPLFPLKGQSVIKQEVTRDIEAKMSKNLVIVAPDLRSDMMMQNNPLT